MKATFGIICQSLEKDRPAYFQWVNEVRKRGHVEFWMHGYHERKPAEPTGEFEQGTFDEQRAIFEKSQRLAREKLGFEFSIFGPHWSGTTAATERAVAATPQIKIWFYGPAKPRYYRGFVFPRVMTLENPTFVPDFAKFQTYYEHKAAAEPVLALQGHPNQWTDARWDGFVKISEFLRAKGCVFMTASEYVQSVSGAKP